MNAPSKKQATNVSLSALHVAEARALGINISKACERGLADAISETRAQRWREENRAAILSSNAYVEAHGLPLAASRLF